MLAPMGTTTFGQMLFFVYTLLSITSGSVWAAAGAFAPTSSGASHAQARSLALLHVSATRGRQHTTRIPRALAIHGDSEGKTEGDVSENLLEERLQKDLNAMFERDDDKSANFIGFTPSNFDGSQIPIPLFTAALILLGSLYLTWYGFYVGLNGFPPDAVAGAAPPIL